MKQPELGGSVEILVKTFGRNNPTNCSTSSMFCPLMQVEKARWLVRKGYLKCTSVLLASHCKGTKANTHIHDDPGYEHSVTMQNTMTPTYYIASHCQVLDITLFTNSVTFRVENKGRSKQRSPKDPRPQLDIQCESSGRRFQIIRRFWEGWVKKVGLLKWSLSTTKPLQVKF